jgi:hypothetical protein
MLSTNKKVPTMHDYFKPADVKIAANEKRGRRLKKRKSIFNKSIDLRPRSKAPRHTTDCTTRGLTPQPKDATSSTSVAAKTSTVAVSAPPTKNNRTNHALNDTMAKAVDEWFRIKDAPNALSKAAFARQKQVKPYTF